MLFWDAFQGAKRPTNRRSSLKSVTGTISFPHLTSTILLRFTRGFIFQKAKRFYFKIQQPKTGVRTPNPFAPRLENAGPPPAATRLDSSIPGLTVYTNNHLPPSSSDNSSSIFIFFFFKCLHRIDLSSHTPLRPLLNPEHAELRVSFLAT